MVVFIGLSSCIYVSISYCLSQLNKHTYETVSKLFVFGNIQHGVVFFLVAFHYVFVFAQYVCGYVLIVCLQMSIDTVAKRQTTKRDMIPVVIWTHFLNDNAIKFHSLISQIETTSHHKMIIFNSISLVYSSMVVSTPTARVGKLFSHLAFHKMTSMHPMKERTFHRLL